MFLLAGHDTTATTLTYALWALGRDSGIQDEVRAEADRIGDHELCPADTSGLRFTIQVLHEALRLCPPAAGIARMVLHDIEVDGYRIAAGTMVAVGIAALHRDPTLWVRPLEFDPARFTAENAEGRDRWHYLRGVAGIHAHRSHPACRGRGGRGDPAVPVFLTTLYS